VFSNVHLHWMDPDVDGFASKQANESW